MDYLTAMAVAGWVRQKYGVLPLVSGDTRVYRVSWRDRSHGYLCELTSVSEARLLGLDNLLAVC